jgi:hypothetical protein
LIYPPVINHSLSVVIMLSHELLTQQQRPCNNSVEYFGCSVSEPFSGDSEPQKLATTIVSMVGMFPHCGVYVLVNILQPPRQTPDCWEHSSVPELPISSGCFLVPHSVSPYLRISWTGSWALRMSTTFCDPSGVKALGLGRASCR